MGLTGVAITEHDWLWTEEELDELRSATPGVQVFAGVEVSAYEGHFLCYGVTDPIKIPKSIKVKDLCCEVHAQGGVVLAAHPYRWGQDFDEVLATEPLLDGIEIMSSNMDHGLRKKAKAAWEHHVQPWAGVGNSDAHDVEVVGACFTVFPEKIRDLTDLVDALRAGATEARERPNFGLNVSQA